MNTVGIFAVIGAYLLGAIPFGLLFSKLLAKRDPREFGSGNIGATNAMRTGGKLVGVLTLLADIGKGALAVGLAVAYAAPEWLVAAVALAAFLGHIYPVYLKFRGGKGVATMFGVMLPWQPWLAVAAFVVWLVALKLGRYVSVASILAGWCLPVAGWALHVSSACIVASLLFALLMTWRHESNIRRLLAGTEPKSGGKSSEARLQGQ